MKRLFRYIINLLTRSDPLVVLPGLRWDMKCVRPSDVSAITVCSGMTGVKKIEGKYNVCVALRCGMKLYSSWTTEGCAEVDKMSAIRALRAVTI